jgi:hypothetical protein
MERGPAPRPSRGGPATKASCMPIVRGARARAARAAGSCMSREPPIPRGAAPRSRKAANCAPRMVALACSCGSAERLSGCSGPARITGEPLGPRLARQRPPGRWRERACTRNSVRPTRTPAESSPRTRTVRVHVVCKRVCAVFPRHSLRLRPLDRSRSLKNVRDCIRISRNSVRY